MNGVLKYISLSLLIKCHSVESDDYHLPISDLGIENQKGGIYNVLKYIKNSNLNGKEVCEKQIIFIEDTKKEIIKDIEENLGSNFAGALITTNLSAALLEIEKENPVPIPDWQIPDDYN